jgi:hypothetical protein
VADESPAPELPDRHARPGQKTLQRTGGGESREIPGSRPRRPARRVCVRPLISGREKILAGPGVVADHRRRTAIRWSSGQPSGMVDQQTGWSISDGWWVSGDP